MPNVETYASAFNSGEFSPRLDARTDFDRYGLAVSRALNLLSIPQGGLTLRPGTRFIKELKTSSTKAALWGFEPSSGAGYIIEAGVNYLRFFNQQDRLAAPTVATTITNGDFATNITGWDDRSTGSASITWLATGKLKLVGAGNGYAWAEQAITVAGGDQASIHIFRFTLSGNPGGKATVQIGTSSTGIDKWNVSGYGIGQHTIAIVPGAATIYFQVINRYNDNVSLDDVSILSNTPLELTNSPYGETDVDDVRMAQSNDVVYLFHKNYAPRKIEHRGAYSWSLTTVFFEDGPWGEINPDIDLAATQLVRNASFDGGVTDWLTSSHNAAVEYDGVQGVVFFSLLEHSEDQEASIWQKITTPAPESLHVMHFQAVGRGPLIMNVGVAGAAADNLIAEDSYAPGWYSFTFTPHSTTFYIRFGMRHIINNNTQSPGLGGVFIYNDRSNLLLPSDEIGLITVTAQGSDFKPFASTDVGRSIRFEYPGREPAWGIITAYTDRQHVTAYMYRKVPLSSTSTDDTWLHNGTITYFTVPTETWRLGAWSDTTGWPRLPMLYQQRLFGANTTFQPGTFWASQSGDFQNFRMDSWSNSSPTTEDDDAFGYTLAAKNSSPIQWFAGNRRLLIGTATGQWAIISKGAALTPLDLAAEPHTSVRSTFIEPVEIDTVAIFVERDKQSVDDIGYNYEIDGYKAADLNILSDHIAGTQGFAQLAYQSKPFALIWVRKADGTLGVLTYKREQNVVGWAPAKIAGVFGSGDAVVESIATIAGSVSAGTQVYDAKNRDELWLVVKRTINGSTKRYIEVMEGFFKGPNRAEYDTRAAWLSALLTAQADAYYVDCGITYSGSSATAMTGLSHLEGQVVYANVNGKVQGPFTVSSGAITLTTAGTKAQIGLRYSWRLRGLKARIENAPSVVGQQKQLSKMVFVVLDSRVFSYGAEATGELGRDAQFFTADKHLAVDGTLYTGEAIYDRPDADFDSDPRYILKGDSPMPFTILGFANKLVLHAAGQDTQ